MYAHPFDMGRKDMGEVVLRPGLTPGETEALLRCANAGGEDFLRQFAIPGEVLKVSDEEFENLDKSYLLRKVKEPFGWSCLTDKKAFYVENYPDMVIERSGIDELMQNYIKGESL